MQLDLKAIGERTNRSADEVSGVIEKVKQTMFPQGKQVSILEEDGTTRFHLVTRRGVGLLNTKIGKFYQFDFSVDDVWEKYSVIYYGSLNDSFMPVFRDGKLLLRIDSGCETGQLFGDCTCECKQQLLLAMRTIKKKGEGLIVNIPRQDGRGLGLPSKLATLLLQDILEVDTVEAANAIAPSGVIDIRTYGGIIGILKYFEVPTTTRIDLATNNPHKARIFGTNGYTVDGYTPIVIPPTPLTHVHLKAKQNHLDHVGLISESVPSKAGVSK